MYLQIMAAFTTMNLKFEAYLFDLDGVLVDTREWVRAAYRHTAGVFRFEASDELLDDLYGRPLRACYESLCALGNAEQLMACHREFQTGNMELQTLFPHAQETLASLKAGGAATALVSSRTGPSLCATLDRFGLETYLDRVVLPEECENHKPHPEPVLIALKDLRVEARRAVMIGDTMIDIRAGQAAGVETVGATYGFIGDRVAQAHPTYLISNLTDLLVL